MAEMISIRDASRVTDYSVEHIRKLVREGLVRSPHSALLHRTLGSLLERTGRRGEAAPEYRASASLASGDPDAAPLARPAAIATAVRRTPRRRARSKRRWRPRLNERMKARLSVACGLAVLFASSMPGSVRAVENASLDEHLEPLRPLLGKTMRGVFKNSKPESPMVDVARWERALNGKAVRFLHSVNDGIYGGETIFVWDAKKDAVIF